MPRPCAVESHVFCYEMTIWTPDLAAPESLNNSGKVNASCSNKRETPRRKAVASLRKAQVLCSSKRETPRHKTVASATR